LELLRFSCSALRSRRALVVENLFLQKQTGVVSRGKAQPRRAGNSTRWKLATLSRLFNWRSSLVVVKPATLILVTIFQANYGPAALVGAQLDSSGLVSSNLSGTQVFFDGKAAPLIYALAGQVSAVVPYEVSGKRQTAIQYEYNRVMSNTVTLSVAPSAPAIFATNEPGAGPGLVLNSDYSLNAAANPAPSGSSIIVYAKGGGTIQGGAAEGALAPGAGDQTLPLSAAIGNVPANVAYSGPAPGEVNGVMQVNLTVPTGLTGAAALGYRSRRSVE